MLYNTSRRRVLDYNCFVDKANYVSNNSAINCMTHMDGSKIHNVCGVNLTKNGIYLIVMLI